MADFTSETAREARDDYESMQMALSTPWGQKLKELIKKIDKNATDKAMRGQTPDNTNVFFESRGKAAAIFEINQMIKDTIKSNDDAVKWQQANPPQESDASENTQ